MSNTDDVGISSLIDFSVELLVINFHTHTLRNQSLTLNGRHACVKHVYGSHAVNMIHCGIRQLDYCDNSTQTT